MGLVTGGETTESLSAPGRHDEVQMGASPTVQQSYHHEPELGMKSLSAAPRQHGAAGAMCAWQAHADQRGWLAFE